MVSSEHSSTEEGQLPQTCFLNEAWWQQLLLIPQRSRKLEGQADGIGTVASAAPERRALEADCSAYPRQSPPLAGTNSWLWKNSD